MMAELSRSEQSRLTNAIVYFAKNTKRCGRGKLFRLLYLLDVRHFKETGKTVTGLSYQAWANRPGPVPSVDVLDGFYDPDSSDPANHIIGVIPGACFDDTDFSPRQLRMLGELADTYQKDAAFPGIAAITREDNEAWEYTFCPVYAGKM